MPDLVPAGTLPAEQFAVQLVVVLAGQSGQLARSEVPKATRSLY